MKTHKVRWLRTSYWTGAILDLLAAVQMLAPRVAARFYGLSSFHPGKEYRYAMGLGASLMLGWTAVLIWADHQPTARKGLLLLTVFPVLCGLVVTEIWAVHADFITIGRMVPTWTLQLAITALFLYSYWNARDLDTES